MKLTLKAFFFLKLQYTEKKVTKFLLSFVLLFFAGINRVWLRNSIYFYVASQWYAYKQEQCWIIPFYS